MMNQAEHIKNTSLEDIHQILLHLETFAKYPILEWNGYGKGMIALHGHQHNHKEYNLKNRSL